MSHDMMTHPVHLELDEEPASLQSWSIESYADNLMDELFEEVDRILDGGASFPTQSVPQDSGALQPIVSSSIALPPVLVSNRFELARSENPTGELLAMDVTVADTALPQQSVTLFDRLLLTVACVSVFLAGAVWLASQGRQGLPFLATPQSAQTAPKVSTNPEVQADAQFMEYFQRSLESLDRQKNATPTPVPPAPAASQAGSNLPTVTVAGNPGQPTGKPPAVLERVYIPVYQPPQFFANLPAASTLPSYPTNSFPVQSAPVAVVPAPAPIHTLVGVLELGNRSAALFEVNGVAQRVNVGEGIGSSGWTLVKISKQEAIVRRNGEVRSIYVGQKF